jgi:hypothetical protein
MRLAWIAVAVCLAAAPAWAQQGGLAALQAMDANGDGSLTRAEAQAARSTLFDRLDADDDGAIDATERAALNGQGQMARSLDGADANNDGYISRAELMGQPYRGFDRLDRNNDDVVSADEIEALRNMRQGR